MKHYAVIYVSLEWSSLQCGRGVLLRNCRPAHGTAVRPRFGLTRHPAAAHGYDDSRGARGVVADPPDPFDQMGLSGAT
jgi:hypothetical protein